MQAITIQRHYRAHRKRTNGKLTLITNTRARLNTHQHSRTKHAPDLDSTPNSDSDSSHGITIRVSDSLGNTTTLNLHDKGVADPPTAAPGAGTGCRTRHLRKGTRKTAECKPKAKAGASAGASAGDNGKSNGGRGLQPKRRRRSKMKVVDGKLVPVTKT